MLKKFIALLSLGLALCAAGCGNDTTAQSSAQTQDSQDSQEAEETQAQDALRAVYLKNDNGVLFVSIEQDSPFTGNIPDEILDEDGNAISEDDLNNGDVVDVYGNGIMLESYPGQYPGITKLVRVEKENQEYIEKYQEMVDQFLPDPDTSQPPELSLSYRQTDAVVTAICDQFGYTWEFTDENGESQVVIADTAHVLQSEGLIQFELEGETQMTVVSAYPPEQIVVSRWEVGQREASKDSVPEGESVPVEELEDGLAFMAEPGYIYEITGSWPEGEATYVFEAAAKNS